jgi:hypothetical protein
MARIPGSIVIASAAKQSSFLAPGICIASLRSQ